MSPDASPDPTPSDPTPSDPTPPDPTGLVWKRMAFLAVVGVVLAALGATYLAVRPAHAVGARAGRSVPLSVSCPTAQFCVAVDDQGNALRFVNGVWSKPRSLQTSALTGVSCTAPDFCVAVGANGDAYVLRGAGWSPATAVGHKSAGGADSSGTSGLSAVSCVGTTFCMAGDVVGRVWTFDGRRWTRPRRIEPRGDYLTDRQAGTAGISGLSCATPTFCVAVTVGGRALIFDGKSWSTPSTLEPAKSVSSDRYLSHNALGGRVVPGPGVLCGRRPQRERGDASRRVVVRPESDRPAERRGRRRRRAQRRVVCGGGALRGGRRPRRRPDRRQRGVEPGRVGGCHARSHEHLVRCDRLVCRADRPGAGGHLRRAVVGRASRHRAVRAGRRPARRRPGDPQN